MSDEQGLLVHLIRDDQTTKYPIDVIIKKLLLSVRMQLPGRFIDSKGRSYKELIIRHWTHVSCVSFTALLGTMVDMACL